MRVGVTLGLEERVSGGLGLLLPEGVGVVVLVLVVDTECDRVGVVVLEVVWETVAVLDEVEEVEGVRVSECVGVEVGVVLSGAVAEGDVLDWLERETPAL